VGLRRGSLRGHGLLPRHGLARGVLLGCLLSAHLAGSVLIEVTRHHLILDTHGYDPGIVKVRLTEQTQLCRGDCHADWRALKLGDRIESATYDGPDGVRIARWVNANVVASIGTVSAINGNVLTITGMKPTAPERDLTIFVRGRDILHNQKASSLEGNGSQTSATCSCPKHDLTIFPFTTIYVAKTAVLGQSNVLHVGDQIHYTATADDPNLYTRSIMGMTIHRLNNNA